MTESEIIIGNDAICKMLGFESTKQYIYKIPNLFPSNENTGWIETNALHVGFDSDWNMLIGAYNKTLYIIDQMPPTLKELLKEYNNFVVSFGIKNFFHIFEGQLHISSCWTKLVIFAKWYNNVKGIV